jgi:hypothetical protein
MEALAVRSDPEVSPRKVRSAVTNGTRLHVQPVGDTAWSRRFKDILGEIISDLGGREGLSEGQRQLARRAATISIQCEKLESVAVSGDDINLEVYGTLTDRLGRCFQRLGLKRQQREVSWRDQLLVDTADAEPAPAASSVSPGAQDGQA